MPAVGIEPTLLAAYKAAAIPLCSNRLILEHRPGFEPSLTAWKAESSPRRNNACLVAVAGNAPVFRDMNPV